MFLLLSFSHSPHLVPWRVDSVFYVENKFSACFSFRGEFSRCLLPRWWLKWDKTNGKIHGEKFPDASFFAHFQSIKGCFLVSLFWDGKCEICEENPCDSVPCNPWISPLLRDVNFPLRHDRALATPQKMTENVHIIPTTWFERRNYEENCRQGGVEWHRKRSDWPRAALIRKFISIQTRFLPAFCLVVFLCASRMLAVEIVE